MTGNRQAAVGSRQPAIGNRRSAIGNRSGAPLAWLAVLAGCAVTPLTNKLRVGEEPFVVAVGEGADSLTDLWAVAAGNGSFVRLTFNRAEERAPRLAPDGRRLAYLRRLPEGGEPRWYLVLLDLLNSAEASLPVPADAGEPLAVGWSADGGRVVLRAGRSYVTPAPPGKPGLAPLDYASAPALDSLTRERLGPGSEGVLEACGTELCVNVGGTVTSLGPEVRGVVRWGPDSLGYFRGNVFEVRPLAGGRVRRPKWQAVPARLRELTHFPGVSSPR